MSLTIITISSIEYDPLFYMMTGSCSKFSSLRPTRSLHMRWQKFQQASPPTVQESGLHGESLCPSSNIHGKNLVMISRFVRSAGVRGSCMNTTTADRTNARIGPRTEGQPARTPTSPYARLMQGQCKPESHCISTERLAVIRQGDLYEVPNLFCPMAHSPPR